MSEGSVQGIVGEFKSDRNWAHNLLKGNGRGRDRTRPSTVIVIWAGFVLAKNRGSTPYKSSGQQWYWYYASMLGSLTCLPIMNGEVFFLSRKAFCASREWRGITVAGTIAARSCTSPTTDVCEAVVGQDWGHTPIWTGHGRCAFTSNSASS